MTSSTFNTLILTVGLPRSGKSTWARRQGYPVVNPDSIRLAIHGQAFVKEAEVLVWPIVEIMVRSLFISGHKTVILDATNLSQDYRKPWTRSDLWECDYKVFQTSIYECIRRAKVDGREDLIPVIEWMFDNLDDATERMLLLTPEEDDT